MSANGEEWLEFERTYNCLVKSLNDDQKDELKELREWMKKLFNYNVPKGKRNRGLFVVMTYKLMAQDLNNNISEEDIELSRILGWTIEILQAFALLLDDIMDQSLTRRGQLCWYRKEEVGLMAINDGILLEQECYHLLKLFASKKPYYTQVMDLLHETMRYTTYGQFMDMSSNRPNQSIDFDLYTKTRLETIYKYKTSYYSFVLPVRYAMYLNLCDSDEEHKIAEQILLKMGYLFQMQDDFLDCFADPELIGKVGTDVEEGKCCWPIVTALELCDKRQLNALTTNYGINCEENVKAVKRVYNELNLEAVYSREEDMVYEDLCNDINNLKTSHLSSQIFKYILSKIYRRQK